jgi:nucleoside-diphosphate-sugar epimerase
MYYTLGALSEIVAAARRKEAATTRYRVRTRLRRVHWDCSKARRMLQWRPIVPLREGLRTIFQAHATVTARN